MQLLSHQQKFIQKNPRRHLLVWETGTGKTIAALEWARINASTIHNPRILIICPKGLRTNWHRSISTFYPHGYPQYEVLSKEQFKKEYTKGTLPKADIVIIDEMHYFSGTKSALSKCLEKYLNKPTEEAIKYVLGLTATPYLSTPFNIYQLGVHLGMGGWWNYGMFFREFFTRIKMGGRLVPVQKRNAEIHQRLAELLWHIGSTVKLSECVDLPDDIITVEYFQLTYEQIRAITTLPYIEAITRWTKTHQICGGYCKGDELMNIPDVTLSSDKRDRLLELVQEIDSPIIVCRYNFEIDALGELLRAKGYNVFVLNGKTKDKQAVIDEALLTDNAILLVNAAVSEGWQYPKADTMIFYSYDFSLKNYVQMKGRIQRIDNIKKCRYVSLLVAGSIDEDVYTSVVVQKMDFHVELYANNTLTF